MEYKRFSLSDNFIEGYRRKRAPFGFNGLGELVYMRTYSRIKDDGKNEMWWETVQRVVQGTYNMQKKHIERYDLGWNAWQAQRSAQEMYERIFNMKFLPPGRGLWSMGTALTEEKGLYAALNNCAFVSTQNLKDDLSKPFTFLMDASMVGVGVGFDTKGAEQFVIRGPKEDREPELYVIPDTREGWVESVRRLLDSYFLGITPVIFDYKKIREEGAPIKGFGGVSSGYEPLQEIHQEIRNVLDKNVDEPISVTTIVDIMNLIGKCVVAGNVRRTAEIVFGDPNSEEYFWVGNFAKWKATRWLVPRAFVVAADEKYAHAEELKTMESLWKKIPVPVLILHGKKDFLAPYKNMEYVEDYFPKTLLNSITLPNENHFIPWTKQQLIIKEIDSLIQNIQ